MARKNSRKRKPAKRAERRGSGRPIWTGSIDFGLVNIPVKLYSAQNTGGLDFDLLDRRDFSRIRYRRVNEKTGKEVDWRQIVKGYQYEKGEYVALSDEDFARANVEASQSIAIVRFVDAAAVSPFYYDTPYYLEPLKNGRRAYALLRTVIRNRQGRHRQDRAAHAPAFGRPDSACRSAGVEYPALRPRAARSLEASPCLKTRAAKVPSPSRN